MIIINSHYSVLFIRSRKKNPFEKKQKSKPKSLLLQIHTTSDFLNLIYHNTTMTCCPCTYYHALSSIISFIYIYHQVNENSQFYWQNKTQLFTVEAKNKEEKWYFLDIPKLKRKENCTKNNINTNRVFSRIKYLLSLVLGYYLHTSSTIPINSMISQYIIDWQIYLCFLLLVGINKPRTFLKIDACYFLMF